MGQHPIQHDYNPCPLVNLSMSNSQALAKQCSDEKSEVHGPLKVPAHTPGRLKQIKDNHS